MKNRSSQNSTTRHPKAPFRRKSTPEAHARVVEEKATAASELAAEFERRKRQQIARAEIELDPIDREILKAHLTHPEETQEQIGDLVGRSREVVNRRMNTPKFKRALGIANRSALEILESNRPRAALVLADLLNSPDERVRALAAKAHLWADIYRETKISAAEDFATFVQEAFEQAEANRAAGKER